MLETGGSSEEITLYCRGGKNGTASRFYREVTQGRERGKKKALPEGGAKNRRETG